MISLINLLTRSNLPSEHIHNDFGSLVKQPIKRHLAHWYSKYLITQGCDVVGITGSAGKTTTKEMLASVLSQEFKTKWTKENIDPVYNIPNTILTTSPSTEKLILEMGIEYPGEMEFYLWLAKPNIGICTSIYWTHTQFFGDMEGVYSEKSKLISSLPKNGFAILNKDDKTVVRMANLTKAKVIWYSTKTNADLMAENIVITDELKTRFHLRIGKKFTIVELPIMGEQFASLALAAAAVGNVSGLSIEDIKVGLEKFSPPPHRMVPIILQKNILMIDDSYNANPLATKKAVKVVSNLFPKRRKIFVLAEMKELGNYEKLGHEEVGRAILSSKFDYVIGLGRALTHTLEVAKKGGMLPSHLFHAKDQSEILTILEKLVKPNDVLLIKGSRSMKMEDLVQKIYEEKG